MNTKVTASLGAGSYDYDALKEATDSAVKAGHDSPEAAKRAVQDAVAATDRSVAKDTDPREVPGYRFEKRQRSIGDTKVTETIQVARPDKTEVEVEKPETEAKAATRSARRGGEDSAGQCAPAGKE